MNKLTQTVKAYDKAKAMLAALHEKSILTNNAITKAREILDDARRALERAREDAQIEFSRALGASNRQTHT